MPVRPRRRSALFAVSAFLKRIARRVRAFRRVEHHEPLGRALQDFLDRGEDTRIGVHRSDGLSYSIEARDFFFIGGRLGPLDEEALRQARGRILDVGAGAGRHALALQERGREVVAIDISPLCVDIMRRRGVLEARLADVFEVQAEDFGQFDTILFLMQSIGMAGSLFGLERLLLSLRILLRPGGQILLDSSANVSLGAQGNPSSEGIDVYFSLDGLQGESFSWLYIGERSLSETARRLGWSMAVLARMPQGEYLARLAPLTSDPRRGHESKMQ